MLKTDLSSLFFWKINNLLCFFLPGSKDVYCTVSLGPGLEEKYLFESTVLLLEGTVEVDHLACLEKTKNLGSSLLPELRGWESTPLYVFSLFPPLQHIFESGHTIPLLTFSFDKFFPGTNDRISAYIFLTRSFGDIHYFGIGAIDKNSHCLCLTKPFIEASSHNNKINIFLSHLIYEWKNRNKKNICLLIVEDRSEINLF